jgi:hypothetical protein
MNDGSSTQAMYEQVTSRTFETMVAWSDANQRVLREMVDLGTGAARESLRLYADLQRNGLEALRDAQGVTARWQQAWREVPGDPAAWWQKAVAEGVHGTQQTFRLVEENAQALTRTAERLQQATEQAGKVIQESLTEAVSRTKDVCTAR